MNRILLRRALTMAEMLAPDATPENRERVYPPADGIRALLALLERVEVDLDIPQEHWCAFFISMRQFREYANSGGGGVSSGAVVELRTALRSALDRAEPAAETRFPRISYARLRAVLEQDYLEAESSMEAQNWKAAIVLLGSVLEAAIYDRLRQNATWTMSQAKGVPGKPKGVGPRDIRGNDEADHWKPGELISFCALNGVLPRDSDVALAYIVQTPRNAIHPTATLRLASPVNRERAIAAKGAIDLALLQLAASTLPP